VTVQPTIEEGSEDKPDGDAMIVGSILPQMVLKNEKGEDVEIATITHDSGVVIFAAPKADTRELFVFFVR
jgi:thioredoxin-dependent peroxiredoxin